MPAKIRVTRFQSTYSVEDEVNDFLEKRAYGIDEVRIQFVTSRIEEIMGGDREGRTNELFEAYVTHPV